MSANSLENSEINEEKEYTVFCWRKSKLKLADTEIEQERVVSE